MASMFSITPICATATSMDCAIIIMAMRPVDTAETKNRTGSNAVLHKAMGWL